MVLIYRVESSLNYLLITSGHTVYYLVSTQNLSSFDFSLPKGLEDVSKYPDLFEALKQSNKTLWTQNNLEKVAGRNLIRVFKEVEAVRKFARQY